MLRRDGHDPSVYQSGFLTAAATLVSGSAHSQALTPSHPNSEKETQTLGITSSWYLLPWIKYLFQLILSQNVCALPQRLTQRTMAHHNGLAEPTRLNSSLPFNRDEHRQGEKTNKRLTKMTTTSDVHSEAVTYLFKWTMGTVSEKGKEVWPIILGIQTDLFFMVALSLMMVSLEELMQILKETRYS